MASGYKKTGYEIHAEDKTGPGTASARRNLQAVGEQLRSLQSVGDALRAAFTIAAGGALAQFTERVINSAAALDDYAEITGASVENLSRFDQVAGITGASMDNVSAGLVKLAGALAGTDEETKGAGRALDALGLKMEDLRGKDPAEAFRLIAVEMSKFSDGMGKTQLAADLLGKRLGPGLLPFMKDLVELGDVNARVTAEQAAQAEKFQNEVRKLQMGFSNYSQAIALDLLPLLNETVNMFKTGGEEVSQFDGSFKPLGETLRAATLFIGNVGFVLKGVGTEIGGVSAQIAAFAKGNFSEGLSIGKMMREDAARARKEFDEWERHILSLGDRKRNTGGQEPPKLSLDYTQAAEKKSSSSAKQATDSFKDMADAINAAHENAINWIKSGEEVEQLLRDHAKAYSDLAAPIEERALQAERELENYGLTETQIERTTLARLEEARAIAAGNGASAEALAYYDREIAARGRLVAALAGREVKQATEEGAKQATQEWKSAADNIERSLIDALLRGFEGGNNIAENFRQTLYNMFRTMVLQPMIRPFIEPLAQGMSGLGDLLGKGAISLLTSLFIPSARGNVFAAASLSALSGRVLERPTLIPFALGGALAGEAGPEAIMPLRRGAGGRLGVDAYGGNNLQVKVNVEVINQTPAQISTESKMVDGVQQLKIFVRDIVRESIINGEQDAVMRTSFGANRRGIQRG